GAQPSFLLGQAFAMWPWLRLASIVAYVGLAIPIALIYAGRLLRMRGRAIPSFLAFLTTGPIGVVFYNIFPALGPIHLFKGQFPWHPLSSADAARLFLEPVPLTGAPNAIPSLHMTWVLLAWWYSRGLSLWERGIALVFVIFTASATLGTGEHYFVDLVVAFPFAVMVEGIWSFGLPWTDKHRLTAIAGGGLFTLCWLGALRYGIPFFRISPAVPWMLCLGTVVLWIWLEQRLPSRGRQTSAERLLQAAPNLPGTAATD